MSTFMLASSYSDDARTTEGNHSRHSRSARKTRSQDRKRRNRHIRNSSLRRYRALSTGEIQFYKNHDSASVSQYHPAGSHRGSEATRRQWSRSNPRSASHASSLSPLAQLIDPAGKVAGLQSKIIQAEASMRDVRQKLRDTMEAEFRGYSLSRQEEDELAEAKDKATILELERAAAMMKLHGTMQKLYIAYYNVTERRTSMHDDEYSDLIRSVSHSDDEASDVSACGGEPQGQCKTCRDSWHPEKGDGHTLPNKERRLRKVAAELKAETKRFWRTAENRGIPLSESETDSDAPSKLSSRRTKNTSRRSKNKQPNVESDIESPSHVSLSE